MPEYHVLTIICERAFGRDQQGQKGRDRGQADGQHKGVGHEAFKEINEKWRD